MNIYKPMKHDEAKIVYGLLRTGAFDHARDFIAFIEKKQASDEQASISPNELRPTGVKK